MRLVRANGHILSRISSSAPVPTMISHTGVQESVNFPTPSMLNQSVSHGTPRHCGAFVQQRTANTNNNHKSSVNSNSYSVAKVFAHCLLFAVCSVWLLLVAMAVRSELAMLSQEHHDDGSACILFEWPSQKVANSSNNSTRKKVDRTPTFLSRGLKERI